MKRLKENPNAILWAESSGFALLIAGSWLTEIVQVPHILFGETFVADWRRAMLRTLIVALAWLWVHRATKQLLKRLHYLEDFLRICGWCRKVCYHDKWLTMEEYFNSKFATKTSHGMCPECLKQKVKEIKANESAPTFAEK